MGRHQQIAFLLASISVILGIWGSDLSACTSIRLKAEDGAVIHARTAEFGGDELSFGNILLVPRGHEIAGTAPGGNAGLKWKAKYAMVGPTREKYVTPVDGLNEKGLAVGTLYHPGYAEYTQVGPGDHARTIAPAEFALWLLTNFATVAEAKKALPEVTVGEVVFPAWGFVPPFHFIVHDLDGQCTVVEFTKGKMVVYDNPLGVMTNSPTFDWHVTNLRNYINLSATARTPIELDGMEFAQFGSGSGTLGLPGDFTPPSRFVRAVAFSRSAMPGKTGEEAVQQAFHILSNFDIPRGSVRDKRGKETLYDITQYTTAADTKNKRYYFHTNDNRRVRVIDLTKMDLDGKGLVFIPMKSKEDVQDLTPVKK